MKIEARKQKRSILTPEKGVHMGTTAAASGWSTSKRTVPLTTHLTPCWGVVRSSLPQRIHIITMMFHVPRGSSSSNTVAGPNSQSIPLCLDQVEAMRRQQQEGTARWHLKGKTLCGPVLCGSHSACVFHHQRMWRFLGSGGLQPCVGGWHPASELQVPAPDCHGSFQCFTATACILGYKLWNTVLSERHLCDVCRVCTYVYGSNNTT